MIIVMCREPNVREVGDFNLGNDIIGTMYEYFSRWTELAAREGVEKILIDPGLGFYYRNLQDAAQRGCDIK